MSCPNSDPSFDKMLSSFVNIHSSNYPIVRKRIYYFICVVVRVILYSLVAYYKDAKYTPYIVGIFSILSVLQLSKKTQNKQWWSKKFQLIMSILITLVCILLIFKVEGIKTAFLPLLLFISLFGGIAQSLFVTFC